MRVMIFALLGLALLIADVEARGGGGGRSGGGGGRGGGHIGGGYRGGQMMNRTPTMSRPNIGQTAARPQIQQRPQVQQRPVVSQRPQVQQRPAVSQRPQISQQSRQQTNARLQQVAQQNRGQSIDSSKLSQIQSRQVQQQNENKQVANRVRDQLQENRPDFDQNFFATHNNSPDYNRLGMNLWAGANWASANSWLGTGWSSPYYYDSAGYYYPTTATAPAAGYAYSQPVQTQAAAQPPTAATTATHVAESGDWMPLGVFALGQNAEQAGSTHRFLQLAMNQSGEIEGVYYNSLSDKTQNVTGIVDKGTQQVVLQLSDSPNSPIATTGFYNLTEDQTPLNVSFNDGSNQTWTMVRLEG